MARIYQMMGTRADQVVRNAIAGGVVTAGDTGLAGAFGGLSTTASGANNIQITFRNTNSAVTPIIQAIPIVSATAIAANRFVGIAGTASNSASIIAFSASTTAATATCAVMVNIFGQHRNDFQTT